MDRRAYSQENRNQRADSAANTVVISPKAEAETPNPTGIKGLFEGLSVSQVTAGALAAVTSMLLSAQIGIAGSVIGVAVGSVDRFIAALQKIPGRISRKTSRLCLERQCRRKCGD